MLSAFAQATEKNTPISTGRRRYQRLDLADHLMAGPPKRVLSLDGGGVRTAMSIAVLAKIEHILRTRYGDNRAFRLADYFDLVGGTSTGAIVAALIAASKFDISDIRGAFFELASRVYGPSRLWLDPAPRQTPEFRGKRLLRLLTEIFGDAALGDDRLATGLGIVSKRVDTDETLVFHNHPGGHRYRGTPSGATGYRHLPIALALRASTATPQHFSPDPVPLMSGMDKAGALFVDASVTTHNNPTFQLFLLCTGKGHGFEWATGSDTLQMVSIGTGALCQTFDRTSIRQMRAHQQAREALVSMIDSAEHSAEIMMRMISATVTPAPVNIHHPDVEHAGLSDSDALFGYQRYQARLQQDVLRQDFGLALSARQLEKVRTMTDPDGLQIAYEIGQAIADVSVMEAHFPDRFDLPALPPLPTATVADNDFAMPEPAFPQVPSVRMRR